MRHRALGGHRASSAHLQDTPLRQAPPLRGWIRASALALALALAAPALAQEPAGADAEAPDKRKQAKAVFKEGQALFEKGEHAQAAVKFEEAFAIDPHPAILYNIARAYEESGDLLKALTRLRDALALTPSANVKAELELKIKDLETFLTDQGVDLTDPARAQWEPTGLVTLECDPPGAEILVDGSSVGRAPLRELKLAQGEHVLQIRSRGFEPQERVLKVVGGKTYLLKPRLKPGSDDIQAQRVQPGVVDVSAPRRGLLIFVDGEPVATTPAGQIELGPGRHTISVEGKGFQTWEEVIEVRSGEVVRVVAKAPEVEAKPQEVTLLTGAEWGWVTMGSGAAFVGLGALLGVVALDQAGDYRDLREDPERPSYRTEARGLGIGADISYGIGLGLVGVGVLILTDEDPQEQAPEEGPSLVEGPRLLPWAGAHGGGLGLGGRW